MPVRKARASFKPISPDIDVNKLVENTEHFQFVPVIKYQAIAKHGKEKFQRLVLDHVINGGKPLVIDGMDKMLDPEIFSAKWLLNNHGEKEETARNLTTGTNLLLTIGHYLDNMSKLAEQFFENDDNYKNKNLQRLYLKDIDCPEVWHDQLRDIIPSGLFYWNDCTEIDQIPCATVASSQTEFNSSQDIEPIAPAGDLMSSLPKEMRAENLMCYIGHEGTYTAAHREMCGSLGQNIMVYASDNAENDKYDHKPGSSVWFMTRNSDRETVAKYFLSELGHDIELENHFADVDAWVNAPFPVYVFEQKVGDFILIPPLAPHQVWNRGTCSIKVAWNRTTVETLKLALSEALPNSRMVCRDEQYRNKAIIYHTLIKYHDLLDKAKQINQHSDENYDNSYSRMINQVQTDFNELFLLFKDIMLSEMFAAGSKEKVDLIPFDGSVTCSYCRSSIFNRFLTCKSCNNQTECDDPYDVCMDCFVIGRGCQCQSKYTWVEQFSWKTLSNLYEKWRGSYGSSNTTEGFTTVEDLLKERLKCSKKTLAQICQEQLKVRPFIDIKKALEEPIDDEDIYYTPDGSIKSGKKKKSRSWNKNTATCHSCVKRHPKWSMAFCKCGKGWCYGILYRAYDLLPRTIIENSDWECPHCRQVCNTNACRKNPAQNPYQSDKIVLGYNTKIVADERSKECLCDFGLSNLAFRRRGDSSPSPGSSPVTVSSVDGDRQSPQITQLPPVQHVIDPALGGSNHKPNPDELEDLSDEHNSSDDNDDVNHSTTKYPDYDEMPSTPCFIGTNPSANPFVNRTASNPRSKRRRSDEEPFTPTPKSRKAVQAYVTPTKTRFTEQ